MSFDGVGRVPRRRVCVCFDGTRGDRHDRRDVDGAHYFVGRTDDMFNCGGENIYPADVEAVLVSPRGGRLPSTLPFSRRLGMLRRRQTQSSRELSRCVAVLHKKPGQEDRSWVEKLPAL